MIETLTVFGALLLMVVVSGLSALLSPELVLGIGAACIVLGIVVGFPAGAVYHLRLHRALRETGAVPRGWYWRPMDHHDRIDPHALARMRPYLLLGGGGFALIMVGGALAAMFVWLG